MTWKKLICLLVGHKTGKQVKNYIYIDTYCARCNQIIDSYLDLNIKPVQKREVSGVRRRQPPTQKKIRGMKPQRAYTKRMWRTQVSDEELEEK